MARLPNLQLKNTEILGGTYKNFSGKKTTYNAAGNRNFCIKLNDEVLAQQLLEDGWNVKCRPARNEDESPLYFIKCNLRDDSSILPDVYSVQLINGKFVRTKLSPAEWGLFDNVYIEYVDIELTPWKSKAAAPTDPYGAYVKTLFVHVPSNDFANMYADDVQDPNEDDDNPFA